MKAIDILQCEHAVLGKMLDGIGQAVLKSEDMSISRGSPGWWRL